MPPFIPKKRLASTPPPSSKPTSVKKQKLSDILDAESRNVPSVGRNTTFQLSSDDSDSSLSDVDSDQFEDVPTTAKDSANVNAESEGEDDAEDAEFEDVELHQDKCAEPKEQDAAPGIASGPLQLKFDVGDEIDYGPVSQTAGRKGPTKREKEARIRTHQLHVQFLLWHNAIRNAWICDREVQRILVSQLPSQIKKEVDKWRRATGISEHSASGPLPQMGNKRKKMNAVNPRQQRDWGQPSQRLDAGKADMSRGDSLLPLLRILSAYWKKRFAITSPGLRKRGYGSKLQLKKDVESFRNDKHHYEKHGERIQNLLEFREIAKICEGSRDVGAQLFTALLRGLGIDCRLVASLQPAGYGWTKAEQMVPRKPNTNAVKDLPSDSSDNDGPPESHAKQRKSGSKGQGKQQARRRASGNQGNSIDVDTDSEMEVDSDDDSVVDVTPISLKQRAPKYDRDLKFPIYWAEAISPVTNQVIPVDPLVLDKPVASTPELLSTFEPRGAKAENAKLVIAYVIGHSSDGTAKDLTVRYLRKHLWPGKTKPFRYPIEKIPVYDRTGRIKRYEDFDWFKHVMSGYVRPDASRTAADDIEDSTDLVPQIPEKKDIDTSVDTLQSLKSSADFVLERFLRREEALRPGANAVRTFVSGKGDNLKSEPVYRRADVERCLTAESWHKEGRHPKANETPLKMVPVRAVTLTRKREAEEHERITGEKQLQGLFSWDQTDYIIPPPIENGIIPKNGYGNIDCFVPSMVPRGAVHIPQRGTVRICKRLEIDYAEAVVGFEFGNKRAVPVINGVVVAKEHEADVKRLWQEWNEEQKKKDAAKQEKLVLDLWRKFIMGLRIREKVGQMYGEDLDAGRASKLPASLTRGTTKEQPIHVDDDDEEESSAPGPSTTTGVQHPDESAMRGGFLLSDDEDRSEPDELVIEHHHPEPQAQTKTSRNGKARELDIPPAAAQYPPSLSMSTAQKLEIKSRARPHMRRRPVIETPDEDNADSTSALSEVSDSADYVQDRAAVNGLSRAESDSGVDLSSPNDLSASESETEVEASDEQTSDSDRDAYLPNPAPTRQRSTLQSSRATKKPHTPLSQASRPARNTRSNAAATTPIGAGAGADETKQQPSSTLRSDKSKAESNVRVVINPPHPHRQAEPHPSKPSSPSTKNKRPPPPHPQGKGSKASATGRSSPYFSSPHH